MHRSATSVPTVSTKRVRSVTNWIAVKDEMPNTRIRVIGATSDYVVGVVYFGKASYGYTFEKGIIEGAQLECWRMSATEEPLKEWVIPTHWIPLPDPPHD